MTYVITVIFAVMTVLFLSGHGAFLIAGYNTASEKDKSRYDKKKLCRVMGCGFLVITVLVGLTAVYGENLPDWLQRGLPIVTVADVAVLVILSNTICKVKNPPAQEETEEEKRKARKTFRYSMIFMAAVCLAAGIFLVTGEVRVEIGEGQAEIIGSYWTDDSVKLADVLSVSYREDFHTGSRVGGLGSLRLLEGNFNNQEFGNYTLYAYTGCREYVVLETAERMVVLNQKTPEETKELYKKLLEATEQ